MMGDKPQIFKEYFCFDEELGDNSDEEKYQKKHDIEYLNDIDRVNHFMEMVERNVGSCVFRYHVMYSEASEVLAESEANIIAKYHDMDDEAKNYLEQTVLARTMWQHAARDLYCQYRLMKEIGRDFAREIRELRSRLGLPIEPYTAKSHLRIVK